MRGWVPWDRKDPSHRPEGQVQGKVVLDGLLRKGEKVGSEPGLDAC